MLSKYGKLAGIAAAIAAVIWVGGYGYWHFHCINTLSAIEAQANPAGAAGILFSVPPETLKDLDAAGDRMLPYIVKGMKSDLNPAYLAAISKHFVDRVNRVMPQPNGGEDLKMLPSDPQDEKDRRCEAIKAIWNQVGENRFRWWKWWTTEGLE